MIDPAARCFVICRAAASEQQKVPLRCTAITRSHISSVILSNDLSRRIPALLTSTSSRPKASTALCTTLAPPSMVATLW